MGSPRHPGRILSLGRVTLVVAVYIIPGAGGGHHAAAGQVQPLQAPPRGQRLEVAGLRPRGQGHGGQAAPEARGAGL